MPRRIIFDGLNLSLAEGTGVATYTRMLAQIARGLGHEIGVVYGSPQTPPKDSLLREVAFFDEKRAVKKSAITETLNYVIDQIRYQRPVRPTPVELSGAVVTRQFASTLPEHDLIFLTRNLFQNARLHFSWTKEFVDLVFDPRPDVFHCTYQLPL